MIVLKFYKAQRYLRYKGEKFTYDDVKNLIKDKIEFRIILNKSNMDMTNYVLRQIVRYDEKISTQSLLKTIEGSLQ